MICFRISSGVEGWPCPLLPHQDLAHASQIMLAYSASKIASLCRSSMSIVMEPVNSTIVPALKHARCQANVELRITRSLLAPLISPMAASHQCESTTPSYVILAHPLLFMFRACKFFGCMGASLSCVEMIFLAESVLAVPPPECFQFPTLWLT